MLPRVPRNVRRTTLRCVCSPLLDALLRGALVCLSVFGIPGVDVVPRRKGHRIPRRFFALAERGRPPVHRRPMGPVPTFSASAHCSGSHQASPGTRRGCVGATPTRAHDLTPSLASRKDRTFAGRPNVEMRGPGDFDDARMGAAGDHTRPGPVSTISACSFNAPPISPVERTFLNRRWVGPTTMTRAPRRSTVLFDSGGNGPTLLQICAASISTRSRDSHRGARRGACGSTSVGVSYKYLEAARPIASQGQASHRSHYENRRR
jgi:hypothetical protein